MAIPTLTINAGGQLEIADGTSGNPVTWNDVWEWDDGGGNAPGEGDVPIDTGGTAKVKTYMTEIVKDAVYLILDDITFGDGSASSYFRTTNEMIYFMDDVKFHIEDNATFQLGILVGDYGTQGSTLRIKQPNNISIIAAADTAAYLKCYGSTIVGEANWYFSVHGNAEFVSSTYSGNSHADNRLEMGTGATWSMKDMRILYAGTLLLKAAPVSMEDVRIHAAGDAIHSQSSGVVAVEPLITSSTFFDAKVYSAGGESDLTLTNPKTNIGAVKIYHADDWVVEQYTCSIHVTDEAGVDLENVTITCDDEADSEVFSEDTDASGDIAEQTIDYKKWTGTDETLTDYSPHTFTLSLAGYFEQTIVHTVDGPVDWEVSLTSVDSVSIPTITSVADNGDQDSITVTVVGTGTIQLYYRVKYTEAWTTGSTREGSGTITQAGLTANTWYEIFVTDTVGNFVSPPSTIARIRLAGDSDTTIETVIYSLLVGDATIESLVGTRVYPNRIKQGALMPAITYEQSDGPRQHVMTDTLGLAVSTYRLTCWAKTYGETRVLAEAVRIELNEYAGTVNTREIKTILIEDEGDIPQTSIDVEGLRRFGKFLDFTIWYMEATS